MTFRVHSRSSEMSQFNRVHLISHYRSIVTVTLSSTVFHIEPIYWSKITKIVYSTCIQHPHRSDSLGILQICLVFGELE